MAKVAAAREAVGRPPLSVVLAAVAQYGHLRPVPRGRHAAAGVALDSPLSLPPLHCWAQLPQDGRGAAEGDGEGLVDQAIQLGEVVTPDAGDPEVEVGHRVHQPGQKGRQAWRDTVT